MKSNIRNFLLKLNSLILALFLVFPSQIMASDALTKKDKSYNESSSIMGLQDESEDDQNSGPIDKANASTLIKSEPSFDESADYIIEKSASLSKTTSTINYKLIFKSKEAHKESEAEDFIYANFATNTNTGQSELKVEKVNILNENGMEEESEFSEAQPNIFDHDGNLSTIGTKIANQAFGMVYYLSSKLDEEAITKIEKGDYSPIFALDMVISNSYKAPLYQNRYKLSVDFKEGESTPYLKEAEETSLVKGSYNPASTNILKTKPATITWTDYIHAKDDKEFVYKINLDHSQVADDAKIKLEFFEAMDKGYILNTKFTQDIPFSDEIKLHIPLGQIARISLTTSVKADTNTKYFTYNEQKLINPDHKKEAKTQEKTLEEEGQEEEDPLGKADQEKDDESNNLTNKEAKNEDSNKEDKKSNSIPDQASNKDNTKEAEDDSTPDDSEAKDKKIESSKEESKEEAQSAISLNKEAYLQKIDDNSLVKAVNQIEQALEAYNKEETSLKDLKASLANIAKDHKLGAKETEEIIGDLIIGLNEEKYKVATINPADLTVDIKEATEQEEPELSDAEIKDLIKEAFAKKDAGQIKEEELEASLATIREENNIDKEAFLNILADLYKNDEIANDGEENPSEKEELPKIDTEKSKEETLADKLAEEDLSTEDFIRFLQAYVKSYDLAEDDLQAILMDSKDQVEKVIGDFTIEEIVAAAYLEGLNPLVLADIGFENVEFITELEYYTETLTRPTNIKKLYDFAREYSGERESSDFFIRNNYVGWKINVPGKDTSGMDIEEIKQDKYLYNNMEFAFYAPEGQKLSNYTLVVEDPTTREIIESKKLSEESGSHFIGGITVPRKDLNPNGYNFYIIAKTDKKRENYAIGMRVSPDKNYVNDLVNKFEENFDELSKRYPFLIKWKDTSAANPYRQGINLIDTRMVYLEPDNWQDSFPYNEFTSKDYNDNVKDTDVSRNTVSIFGNIDKEGNITWTISETFTAEKLENKNSIGSDAFSAKASRGNLGNPTIEILVRDGASYKLKQTIPNASIEDLRNSIGAMPGTIVNYSFKETVANPTEQTTLSLDSGKSASISYKEIPSLEPKTDTSKSSYTANVRNHPEGQAGYEIATDPDTNAMHAFIPEDPSIKFRPDDPGMENNGVMVFCMNLGKPNPTQQYKYNHSRNPIEKHTLPAGEDQANGNLIASYANVPGAKTSPLYKKVNSEAEFDKLLYDYLQRLFWYAQEMVDEYGLTAHEYYNIVQYNVYYYISGAESARTFRYPGFLDALGRPYDAMPGKQGFYADELRRRIEKGEGWDSETKKNVDVILYRHNLTGKFQQTITGDVRVPEKKGQIEVRKTTDDNKPLAGATFQLRDERNRIIKTLTTGVDGKVKFDDLEFGTYYIKEIQGPSGYMFDRNAKAEKVVVDKKNRIHVLGPFINQKNEIEFIKENQNAYPMEGVVFELRRNGRPLIAEERTSGQDGKISWQGLTPGSYQVVEKDLSKHPKYSENEGKVVASFRVDGTNNIINKRVYAYFAKGDSKDIIVNKENKPRPIGIEFTKVDANTSKALRGAEFILEYKKPGSNIFREFPGSRRVSDGRGKLVWNNLVDGDYRIIETKFPSDPKYQTDLNLGEKARFKITKDAQGYYQIDQTSVNPSDKKIKNIEKPEEPKPETKFGKFELTKEDKETQDKLQGVEFTLTSDAPVGEEGKEFDYKVSKTTDENGKINFEELYPGTYTLKETKQLPGYQENTKTWTVEVDKDGNTTVKGGGEGSYKLEFQDNDLGFRNINYAFDIKDSLKATGEPGEMILTITIKPRVKLDQIRFEGQSYYYSSSIFNNNVWYLSSVEVGKEVSKSYKIKIKDMDTFEKDKFTQPIYRLVYSGQKDGGTDLKAKFKLVESSGSSTITIANEKEQPNPAKITIRKYDSGTNLGLGGAEFKLYQSELDAHNDRGPIASATTNDHGFASFNSDEIVPNESYYVKEVKAPYGYKIKGNGITQVWASYDDNQIYKDIPNDKNNARFELYKKGSDGKYLSEVEFKLTNKSTDKEETLTTDANGYLSYDKLETSTSYVLEEVKTQDGYVINKNKATIKVDSTGKLTVNGNGLLETKEGEDGLTFVVTNTKAPSIDFVKADEVTGKRLAGAQFMLKKDGEDLPDSLTSSDENGRFAFTNLEDGSYDVLETVSPDGYPYLAEPKEVAKFVVKDGIITEEPKNKTTDDGEYVVYNKANEINFKKVDADDKNPLAGAEFDLVHLDDFIVEKVEDHYDPQTGTTTPIYKTTYDKTKVKHASSDKNGSFRWSMARPGKYIVIETKAPNDAYKAIPEGGLVVAEFTVDKDTFEIKNIVVNDEFIEDSEAYEGTDHTVTKDINITNKKPGSGQFEINKVDQGKTAVSGAKFLLRDIATNSYIKKDGSYTEIISEAWNESDASGNIKYQNLSNGTYKLQEYKAPDGYKKSSNTWKVVVNNGTTTITLEDDFDEGINKDLPSPGTNPRLDVTNIKNEIEFTKMTKDTTTPLEGAEFEIWWDQQAKGVSPSAPTDEKYIRYPEGQNKTYTTGTDGKIKLEGLPTGHYKIYETQAPAGHFIEDKPFDNEVIKDAKGTFVRDFYVDVFGNITIENASSQDDKKPDIIYNTPNKGRFKLLKADSTDRALLGAKFKLTGQNKYSEEHVSDDNGYIEFNDLSIGEYTLEELEAPKGYIKSEQKWTITVSEDGSTAIKAEGNNSDIDSIVEYSEIRYLNSENKSKLNSKGYLIANEKKATEEDQTANSATIKILNRKPSMPQTGGAGTKIAFAIIGTAVMLAGIAYFGIFQNDKNRRRSNR